MKIKRFAQAVFLTAALTACAGTPVDWNAARNLQVGMTTQEVEAQLGSPYMVTSMPDGSLVYIWSYANVMTGRSGALRLPFKEGKLVTAPVIPNHKNYQ